MGAITRLLVPNRGEIAVRIARSCREMGIASVLAYSEADDIHFVRRFFDDAVSLGSGDARDTYLSVAKVIDAARKAGADALHPGYGFLSERAELAAACVDAGVTFVGPKAESIAAMGSKAESRRLMQRLGVPVVPGYDGEDQSLATLTAAAEKIGLPLLVKASAGGGGKGMKIVRAMSELQAAIESAQREALKAFGDDRLLLERYIEAPRHVEFQIFGDSHGNVLHLYERDCSIQRRHQKVVEESPAPRYSAELRQRMAEAAIAAARGVDYQNAGTVEFIVTPEGEFYFLEMNTRLQVEHPVTEQVLGVDLVRAQLDVAAGKPFPFAQSELQQRGHALEVRIYAEDPDDRFLPQTGTIALYAEPSGPGVRVDSGVTQGSEVGVKFDPMLAKLICFASDRDAAIARLERALRDYTILGTKTNVSWLRRVIAHPAFREGLVSTRFLADHEESLRRTMPTEVPLIAAALASAPKPAARAVAANGKSAVPSVWELVGGRGPA
ncbi:MAG TPA: biotin carboxylase N-terminal domain-containing protein [Thermoanaerobaculia bacterium]|nr:biotin carboxylase N-terminal domain-containing protein [Thermoanaerobaculia bacterium]